MFPQVFVAWNHRHIDICRVRQIHIYIYTQIPFDIHIFTYLFASIHFVLLAYIHILTHIYIYMYTNICISTYFNHRFATQNWHIYVTKCCPCFHFATIHCQKCMKCCSDTKNCKTPKPSNHRFIAPATQNTFVGPTQAPQMQSLNRKMYHNTSTMSRIHCSCHRKNTSLKTYG